MLQALAAGTLNRQQLPEFFNAQMPKLHFDNILNRRNGGQWRAQFVGDPAR